MREQFDKKLVEKIKDSFLQNEEPFDPKEWEKFSRSYFGTKKKGLLPNWGIWIAGIAAALVMAFFLIPGKGTEESPLLSQADSLSVESKSFKADGDTLKKDQKATPDDLEEVETFGNNNTRQENSQKSIVRNPGIKSLPVNVSLAKGFLNLSDSEERKASQAEIGMDKGSGFNWDEVKISEISPNLLVSKSEDWESKPESEKAQEIINEWLADATPELEDNKDGGNFAKTLRFGVLVAPQTISNATQALNFGGGLMTEFSFSNRLKLDVGLAYAKQYLTPTAEGNRGDYIALNTQDRQASFSNNALGESYELSFGQLEIPVNLKYRLLEKNTSAFYLITGLSNMVYLNQKNVGTFSAANFSTSGAMAAQPMVRTFTEVSQPEGNTNSVDRGTLLNFSCGYEYNLANGTFLSLEPFYKMSIGNQTFVNQQFSIGGINLRVNFQLKK